MDEEKVIQFAERLAKRFKLDIISFILGATLSMGLLWLIDSGKLSSVTHLLMQWSQAPGDIGVEHTSSPTGRHWLHYCLIACLAAGPLSLILMVLMLLF